MSGPRPLRYTKPLSTKSLKMLRTFASSSWRKCSSTFSRDFVSLSGATPVARKAVIGRSGSSASVERSTERNTSPGAASVYLLTQSTVFSSSSDSGGVSFVPAFTGLGAPDWDPYARGAIIGLTRGTTAAHLARAALDGVALQVADLLQGMTNDLGQPVNELRVDGGASVNNTLMQIQADVLQIRVVRPKVTETTARGAAYLAGLAIGVWPDRNSIAAQWNVDHRFEPKISADEAADRRTTWRRAVERAKGWAQ